MINNLNNTPKQDNALQVARTAGIPSNEKYTAAEWNAIVNKINEIITDLDLGQITDSVTKTTASNLVRLVEGALIENQLTIRNLPNATTEEKMLLLNSLGEAALADITDYIKKLEVSDPEGQYVLLADGTRVDPNTLIEEKEIVAYDALNPRPAVGEVGKLYIDTDTDNGYLWNELTQEYVGIGVVDLSNYYNKQEVDGLLDDKLDTDMSNLDGDILEADRKVIRGKLGAAWEGFDNTNSEIYSASVGGGSNVNSGNASASVGGGYNQNTGDSSVSAGGGGNVNSGNSSASVGGNHLENKTFNETSRGRYNLSESNHANSDIAWHDDDLIESVGGGTAGNRFNLFARYKSGAFYWIKKTLSTITNAVKGFHAADEDGRLNYYDGTAWKKYSLEGEGSGGGLNFIKIEDQFDNGGDLDFNLILDEGIYVAADNDFRLIVNAPYWLAIDTTTMYGLKLVVYKQNGMTVQEMTYWHPQEDVADTSIRIYDGSTWTSWRSGHQWVINHITPQINNKNYIKETNNNNEIKFWKGTQAEYDAITTKDTQTLYIDSNSGLIGNGVTATVTASVITNYDIDIATQTEHWNLTMTGDTDFDFANMFTSGYSKVITITLEGDYAFTFPAWLKSLETNDDYDTITGTLAAEIVINIKNGGVTPSGYYSLQMKDYAL